MPPDAHHDRPRPPRQPRPPPDRPLKACGPVTEDRSADRPRGHDAANCEAAGPQATRDSSPPHPIWPASPPSSGLVCLGDRVLTCRRCGRAPSGRIAPMRRLACLAFVLAGLGLASPALAVQPTVGGGMPVSAKALAGLTPPGARLGRGFGSRGRTVLRPRSRSIRPRRTFRGVGHVARGLLRLLGIMYLAHWLFGIGAGGGSPLGLLIV